MLRICEVGRTIEQKHQHLDGDNQNLKRKVVP